MAQYRPSPLPASLEGGAQAPSSDVMLEYLREYIRLELERIVEGFTEQEFVQLTQLTVAPTKPREGMVVYADGTSWDPGSGEGYYGYYAGSWAKLG